MKDLKLQITDSESFVNINIPSGSSASTIALTMGAKSEVLLLMISYRSRTFTNTYANILICAETINTFNALILV